MKAILILFLTNYLRFSDDRATTILHSFVVLAYLTPLLGGPLADSYLGKFRTILYLSMVYCLGMIVVAVTAIPGVTGHPPHWWGLCAGLFLVALGTGGIKPCVSAFGGDQFDPASQGKALALFFSLFYASINVGSLVSMISTPMLRDDVSCFGQDDCYSLAFGVPALLMLVAMTVFVVGRRQYIRVPVRENVLAIFLSVVWISLRSKLARCCRSAPSRPKSSEPRKGQDLGWLEPAVAVHGASRVADCRAALRILLIFIPASAFWSCYDQTSSRWTLQALRMNGHGVIKPDQIQALAPILVVLFIPLFEKVIYPGLGRLGVTLSPLQRMGLGTFGAAVAFVITAMIQFSVDKTCCNGLDSEELEELHRHGEFGDCREASCVSVFWQVPAYAVLVAAEVLFSISGLAFAYSEAPESMKGIMQAGWLLTVAAGNVVVIITAESALFSQAIEFFFFAGLLVLVTGVHTFLAVRYTPNDSTSSAPPPERVTDVALGDSTPLLP